LGKNADNRRKINGDITASRVMLIGDNGKSAGVIDTDVALRLADDAGFDLIEMDARHDPPIVKMGDASEERFKEQQKAKRQRHSARVQQVKEIRLRPNIESHDLEVKKNQAVRFLSRGDKVRLTVQLRGRERDHKQVAYDCMKTMVSSLEDVSVISTPPTYNGSAVTLILSPSAR
jgi:translation initiation factor IF-3